jgi:DNA-directed RNA polymerase specialized sigma subunit
MTAKEYLSQARILDKLIETDINEIQRLRTLSTSLGTMDYASDRVQSSTSGDKLCEIVAKIVDLSAKINREIDRYVELKSELREVIDEVQPKNLSVILKMRYLCGESWNEIAEHMGCSYRWVVSLHGQALAQVKSPKE